jgi:hypothetical protein
MADNRLAKITKLDDLQNVGAKVGHHHGRIDIKYRM